MSAAPSSAFRSTQLDGLRAFAVAGVLYTHLWNPESSLGALGVRLFFIISGYLITSVLLRARFLNKSKSLFGILGSFYSRRFLRIFPAYYMVLFVAALCNLEGVRATLGWHFLYMSNILYFLNGNWNPWPTDHLWSLSVEEQFYLIWPLIVLYVPSRWLPFVFVVTIVAAVAFRGAMFSHDPTGLGQFVLTPVAFDALGVGAMLASAPYVGVNQTYTLAFLIGSAALSLLALISGVADYPGLISSTLGEFAAIPPLALIVFGAAIGIPGWVGRVLNLEWIQGVGRISYGIYLWHSFVAAMLFKAMGKFSIPIAAQPNMLRFMGVSLVTIAVATLSWRIVEAPLNSLKKHFPYVG